MHLQETTGEETILNILLAEDDRHLGVVIKNELEEENHEIDLVHDGVEAVLHFIDKSYNIILIDIAMPKLDGLNALKIMKRLRPEMPVITFSGNAAPHQMEDTIRAGAIRCFTKPFTIEELKGCIRQHSL